MNCKKCNNPLREETSFCTKCGTRIHTEAEHVTSDRSGILLKLAEENTQMTKSAEPDKNSSVNKDRLIGKIHSFIHDYGEPKINLYLSAAVVVSMLLFKLLGYLVIAILSTAINGYLIYLDYKKHGKLNVKMCIFSSVVLLFAIILTVI